MLNGNEQDIKRKVEGSGIPLKDWDIQINYGIKTGFNKAFIIDSATKDELIKKSPKSEEIIRPILRGRDIKKFRPQFSNLYLITTFPSLKIDIEEYPAIKSYLLSFDKRRLAQTGEVFINEQGEKVKSRKKTFNKWFETQDTISYWKEFEKPKIIYPNMTKYLPFVYDKRSFYFNDKAFMITGEYIPYLVSFLNSQLFKFCFIDNFPELQGGTREVRKVFFDKIPVKEPINDINDTCEEILELLIQAMNKGDKTIRYEKEINKIIYDFYNITSGEREIIEKNLPSYFRI